MTTWVEDARGSGYDVTHLPYGVFSHDDDEPRVGARIGRFVIDLAPLAASDVREEGHVFESPTLNAFMALGRPAWREVRSWLVATLTDEAGAAELERAVDLAAQRFGEDVPLPDWWGGFVLRPETIEFWESRPRRLHERVRYSRVEDGSWRTTLLAP